MILDLSGGGRGASLALLFSFSGSIPSHRQWPRPPAFSHSVMCVSLMKSPVWPFWLFFCPSLLQTSKTQRFFHMPGTSHMH